MQFVVRVLTPSLDDSVPLRRLCSAQWKLRPGTLRGDARHTIRVFHPTRCSDHGGIIQGPFAVEATLSLEIQSSIQGHSNNSARSFVGFYRGAARFVEGGNSSKKTGVRLSRKSKEGVGWERYFFRGIVGECSKQNRWSPIAGKACDRRAYDRRVF